MSKIQLQNYESDDEYDDNTREYKNSKNESRDERKETNEQSSD